MIVLGRIVAPFGVQGWVRIHPFGDDPLSWNKMPQWWLAPSAAAPETGWRALKPCACRVHGKGLVAAFEEIPDRDTAETFEGWYIGAPREALPAPGENEYYWHDLIGLVVENGSGETLGTVSGLLSTGAHDVLQVRDGDVEHLIPFAAAYVPDVDLAARRIRVTWERDWS